MEKIKKILKRFGLSATETKIYLAGMAYPTIGVNRLERETGIKRTTIYHALNTLGAKGLVSKSQKPGHVEFTMAGPDSVKKLINKEIESLEIQKTEIEKIAPELEKLAFEEKSGVKVSHFEGIEGIKLIVEEALYCKDRKWDIVAPAKNFFSEFDSDYAKYFISKRKKRSIIARSLWEKSEGRRTLGQEELRERNPRYLPDRLKKKFSSVIIIFDDKVAIISSLKDLSAILIESDEIRKTFSLMFEGMWIASEDYKQ